MLANHTDLAPPHPPHRHCPTSLSLTRLQADSQEAPSLQSHCASASPGTRAPNWAETVTSVVFNRKVPTLITSCLCFQLSTHPWALGIWADRQKSGIRGAKPKLHHHLPSRGNETNRKWNCSYSDFQIPLYTAEYQPLILNSKSYVCKGNLLHVSKGRQPTLQGSFIVVHGKFSICGYSI